MVGYRSSVTKLIWITESYPIRLKEYQVRQSTTLFRHKFRAYTRFVPCSLADLCDDCAVSFCDAAVGRIHAEFHFTPASSSSLPGLTPSIRAMKVRLELDVDPSEEARVTTLISALRDFVAVLSAYSPAAPSGGTGSADSVDSHPKSSSTGSAEELPSLCTLNPFSQASPFSTGYNPVLAASSTARYAPHFPSTSPNVVCPPSEALSLPVSSLSSNPAASLFDVEVSVDTPESNRALKPFDGRPPSPDPVPSLEIDSCVQVMNLASDEGEAVNASAPGAEVTGASCMPIFDPKPLIPSAVQRAFAEADTSALATPTTSKTPPVEPALFAAVARKTTEPSLFTAIPHVTAAPGESVTEEELESREGSSITNIPDYADLILEAKSPNRPLPICTPSKSHGRESKQRGGRVPTRKTATSANASANSHNNKSTYNGNSTRHANNDRQVGSTGDRIQNEEQSNRRSRTGRGGRLNTGNGHGKSSGASPDGTPGSSGSGSGPRSNVKTGNSSARSNSRKRPQIVAITTPQGIFVAVAVSSISVKRAVSDLEGMLSRKNNPVTHEDIVNAATAEIVDPAKVCNHPSRGLNVVRVLIGLGEKCLRLFKQEFVSLAEKQFLLERHVECDRAQFLGYSDGLAALVEENCLPADAAMKTIWRLLLSRGCWTAAVTTLCKLTETCNGSLEVRCVDQELVEKVKAKLNELAEKKEFLYDITYLNGAMGWGIRVPQ